jgi:GYF domain 2
VKYYIQRQSTEYGPYTLPELQRYLAQGNILMTDLTRSEGMTDWVPVSQVIGNIPVPVQPQAMPGPAPYQQAQPYGVAPAISPSGVPNPPNLHWALVLLFGVLSCGIFLTVWLIVEAVWVRKIKADSKGLLLVLLAVGGFFISGIINGVNNNSGAEPGVAALAGLIWLASLVLNIVAVFQMRSDIENYYNTVEPINLRLSGVMTFFFAVFYFQYHFTRINEWKKTGYLQPQ